MTTGTTLVTAAELLLEAGVATVYGATLMHTERTALAPWARSGYKGARDDAMMR